MFQSTGCEVRADPHPANRGDRSSLQLRQPGRYAEIPTGFRAAAIPCDSSLASGDRCWTCGRSLVGRPAHTASRWHGLEPYAHGHSPFPYNPCGQPLLPSVHQRRNGKGASLHSIIRIAGIITRWHKFENEILTNYQSPYASHPLLIRLQLNQAQYF